MDRRRFLQMLGIAPVAFNPHRVYFDMGRRLWLPQLPTITSYTPPIADLLDQLNAVTQKLLDAQLTADGWPDLAHIRGWQSLPLDTRRRTPHTPTGLGIIIP